MRVAVFLACIALAFARRPGHRVSGGQVSPVGSRPYMAAILYSDNSLDQYCGGALIHPQWVLTSSFCYGPSNDVYVGLGYYDLMNDDTADGAINVLGTWHLHPDFETDPFYANDIALIKLDTPVTLGSRINTVKMPVADSNPSSGASMLVSGWGLTSADGSLPIEMSQSVVTVSSLSTCTASWGSSDIDDTLICSDSTTEDICQGDDGGPAVTNYNENSHDSAVVIQGVAVEGFGCWSNNLPSLYTRVSAHCSWIDAETNGDVTCN